LDCDTWKYRFTEPGKSAPILVAFSALIHPGSAASRHAIPSPPAEPVVNVGSACKVNVLAQHIAI
jgi:hypothetical protein